MVKLKSLLVTEIGETTETYDWDDGLIYEDMGMAYFTFYSDDIKYEVKFELDGNHIFVQFAPVRGELDLGIPGKRHTTSTNQGNQFKIVATVMEISKHVWKNRKEIFGRDHNITHFEFNPSGSRTDNKRVKLYSQFINKQFPSADIKPGSANRLAVYP